MEAAAEIESDSHLDDVLDEVSGHLNAQHARLVDAAVVMLANRRWWSGEGVEQPQQYLAWRTALSPQRARQVVTVAERAAELPTCMGRFRAGELAIDQMAAIAKRAPWWTDTQIAGIAARLTVAQLRRVLARYPFPLIPKPDAPDTGEDEPADAAAADAAGDDTDTDTETDAGDDTDDDTDAVTGAEADDCGSVDGRPERDPAAGRARPESLWFGWDDDGRFRMNLDADADTGLIVEHALRHARDRLYRNHNDDRRDRVDWIDALRDVAQRALTHTDDADDSGGGGGGGGGRSDPFRINLHLDTDTNLTDHNGRWLPDSIRQHVSCDGLLSPVFYRDAVPMAVGRTQRVIPARIRRQVIHRDSGVCRVPGCGCDMVVEIHHIIHWEHGGVTETWNLISLCPQHHRLHHQGRLGITGNADLPDGVTFTNRHGRIIATSGAEPTLPEAPPPSPTGTYQHPSANASTPGISTSTNPNPATPPDNPTPPHAA